MGANQQFSLRWNNYVQHITCAFDNLRSDEDLVDVTLSCEGRKILAHKMLLSACSTYFKNVFKENPCKHPVIIFRNVRFEDLVAIVDFMYHGEVNVDQEQLSSFLTTAEMLAVQGLTDGTGSTKENNYKDDSRKKQSLLESSLLGAVQDLSNSRPSSQTKSTSKLNIPSSTPTTFYSPSQSSNNNGSSNGAGGGGGGNGNGGSNTHRPTTPNGSRKRRCSPVKVVNSINSKECESEGKQNKKKAVLAAAAASAAAVKEFDSVEMPIVPKVEVNDFDDNDSSYSEQESGGGLMDVSQLMDKTGEKDSVELYNTNSRDSPHPVIKAEGVPASEIDKGLVALSEQTMLKPGTSGNIDSLQGWMYSGQTDDKIKVSSHVSSHLWVCEICGKSFKHKDSRRQHYKSHEGSTECPICHNVLSRKYELKVHMRKRHNINLLNSQLPKRMRVEVESDPI